MYQCPRCRHVFAGEASSCPACHVRFVGTKEVGSLLPSYEEEAEQRKRRAVLSKVAWLTLALAVLALIAYFGMVVPSRRGASLLHAVQRGDLAGSREILRGKTSVDYRVGNWRPTPLMVAVTAGRADLVELLLENGADVEATLAGGPAGALLGTDERTSLHLAALGGREDIVRLLLAKKAKVDRRQIGSGKTALLLAAEGGQAKVVSALLSAGADANLRDAEGKSALIIAAERGYLPVAQALVAHGAAVNTRFRDEPVAAIAARKGNLDVVAFLVAQHAEAPMVLPSVVPSLPRPPRSLAEETVRRYAARLRSDDIFVVPGIPPEMAEEALRWSKAAGERPLVLMVDRQSGLLVTDVALYQHNSWSSERKSFAEISSVELRSAWLGGSLYVNGINSYWSYLGQDRRRRLDALAHVLLELSNTARGRRSNT